MGVGFECLVVLAMSALIVVELLFQLRYVLSQRFNGLPILQALLVHRAQF